MKKSLLIGSGILVAAAFVSVYLFGLHHGRTGEGLTIIKPRFPFLKSINIL